MDREQVSDQISKATLETTDVVGAKRRAFLNAALLEHLATEISGDLAAIVRTFSEGGQTVFNGVIYDTPEQLTDFHRNFGWDGRGLLSDIGGEIIRLLYTHDSVIVEFVLRATVDVAVGDAPAGRSVAIPLCVIYRFDESSKVESERAYFDSGALLSKPILPL